SQIQRVADDRERAVLDEGAEPVAPRARDGADVMHRPQPDQLAQKGEHDTGEHRSATSRRLTGRDRENRKRDRKWHGSAVPEQPFTERRNGPIDTAVAVDRIRTTPVGYRCLLQTLPFLIAAPARQCST